MCAFCAQSLIKSFEVTELPGAEYFICRMHLIFGGAWHAWQRALRVALRCVGDVHLMT
jgi:hypothetical protein